MSFAWTDCVNANAPWVQVDAWRDGTIRYVGSEKVKTRDPRIAKIGVSDVEQLITAAQRFIAMRGRKPLDAVDARKRNLPPTLTAHECLQATADYDGSRQRAVASFESRHVEAFNSIAGRVTPIRELACPGPVGNYLWSGNACAFPIMNLMYMDSKPCVVTHQVNFYQSGDVHHSWSYLSPGRTSSSPDFEKIVAVSPAELEQLVVTAKGFAITGEESFSDPGASPYYLLGTPDELLQFIDLLASTAEIQWQAQIDPRSPRCVQDSPYAQIRYIHITEYLPNQKP